MEEKEQDFLTDRLLKIDLYSLIKDIILNFWVIILCGVICGMWGNMYASYLSTEGGTYTASTTLIVSVKGSESQVYSNRSSAETMANGLSSLMSSNLIQKKVCADLDLAEFTAKVDANVITDTNLLELDVTDSSPELAYRVLNSIMDNYQDVATAVIGNVIVEVLNPATVPTNSNTWVNTRYYTERGVELGLLAGLLLIAFMSIMNDTIKSPRDLSDKLDAKALGTIYFEQKYKTIKSFLRHGKNSILITNPTTSFSFVESYKKITAKVAYVKKPGEGLAIVITSILENEGKSTVATNIALTLAQTKASKVLIVDCDLRKPAQSLVLNGLKTEGLSLPDYLKGNCSLDSIISFDEKSNLYSIYTSKELETASELLSGDRMEELIRILKTRFDYIILDTPPLAGAADAESLADEADATILVVRYDQVQAADINDSIDLLSGCRAVVAGCVLNNVHTIGRASRNLTGDGGYGRYYGKYYKHYYSRTGHGKEEEGAKNE